MPDNKHIRHSWIGWNGRKPGTEGKCVTCGVIRKQTASKGFEFYRNGIKLESNPSCTKQDLNF
jgi:hypothetical protein